MEFTGDHFFLSPLYRLDFVLDGEVYPSEQHAFAALKTLFSGERTWVLQASTPSKAAFRGKRVTPRPGWVNSIQFSTMASIVEAKFSLDELSELLLATGDAHITYGNKHHDQLWGDCHCMVHRRSPGRNLRGKLLMATREYLLNRSLTPQSTHLA